MSDIARLYLGLVSWWKYLNKLKRNKERKEKEQRKKNGEMIPAAIHSKHSSFLAQGFGDYFGNGAKALQDCANSGVITSELWKNCQGNFVILQRRVGESLTCFSLEVLFVAFFIFMCSSLRSCGMK